MILFSINLTPDIEDPQSESDPQPRLLSQEGRGGRRPSVAGGEVSPLRNEAGELLFDQTLQPERPDTLILRKSAGFQFSIANRSSFNWSKRLRKPRTG